MWHNFGNSGAFCDPWGSVQCGQCYWMTSHIVAQSHVCATRCLLIYENVIQLEHRRARQPNCTSVSSVSLVHSFVQQRTTCHRRDVILCDHVNLAYEGHHNFIVSRNNEPITCSLHVASYSAALHYVCKLSREALHIKHEHLRYRLLLSQLWSCCGIPLVH